MVYFGFFDCNSVCIAIIFSIWAMSYANGWSWHAAQCPKFKRFLINKTQSPTTYMQKTGWTNYSSSLVWSGKEVYLGCDHSGIFNINHFPVYRPFLARWKTGWSWSKPALDHWEGSLLQLVSPSKSHLTRRCPDHINIGVDQPPVLSVWASVTIEKVSRTCSYS